MNKLGQVGIFLGIMLAIVGLWIAAITSRPVKDIVDTQRDADHLNCTSSTLTTGGTLACLGTDLILPIYILTIIAASIGALFWATRGG
jgi:hypothetical protein